MKKFIFFFLAALAITACSNDDIEAPSAPESSVNVIRPNSRVLRNGITEEEYFNKVVNYGWKEVATYLVDSETGERSTHDYFRGYTDEQGVHHGGALGVCPIHFYFMPEKFVMFENDFESGRGYTFTLYTPEYDWEHSAIDALEKYIHPSYPWMRDYPYMYIESVDDDQMSVLIPTFSAAGYLAAYFNSLYIRMTPEELEATCKQYGYKM